MGGSLEFWFEFASPYCYPAAIHVAREASAGRITVDWRPFLLGPIFRAQGWSDSPFNLYPAKGRYMWRDLQRICERRGLPFQKPPMFPRSGLLAARLATLHRHEAWLPKFVLAIYRANFASSEEIDQPETVAAALDQLGLDSKPLITGAMSEVGKQALRLSTAEATAKGIFGAPSFIAAGELFWGGDRLAEAIDWASSTG